MIPPETIAQIFDTARIEEVVGDFVSLKKKGANLWGRCPFHNEKTPSFSVSPAKGIYKCFGCGKGGNSVNFIMDHEHLPYPDALRFLARKYGIEVVEEQRTPEQEEGHNKREAMFLALAYAQRQFSENLWNTDEGRSIGLGYFRERGFSDSIIEQFQLGYAFDRATAFTDRALEDKHTSEMLVATGLSMTTDDGRVIDRFRGRVIFPIHNVSGRVIGFGGRILRTDKKVAKYVNSPENEVYHKKETLYGIHQSKRSIIEQDVCLLVEGYTDVISLHQAGITNVVASSGTSLTQDQIRLIRRYSQNLTILYDGDLAGIKAALRGIDMVLEEGLNVRVLLFPDGEDPDSFSRSRSGDEVREFIKANTKDFIRFKTELLTAEAKGDPIQMAGLIKEVVSSIALIPDAITRGVYLRDCAQLMQMDEQTLVFELNRLRRKRADDKAKERDRADAPPDFDPGSQPVTNDETPRPATQPDTGSARTADHQERDLIRLLLMYGHETIKVRFPADDGIMTEEDVNMADHLVHELLADEIRFDNPIFQQVFNEFVEHLERHEVPTSEHFIQHPDPNISRIAVDIQATPHTLSDRWQSHNIFVKVEQDILPRAARSAINSLKLRKLDLTLVALREALKNPVDELAEMETLSSLHELLSIRSNLAKDIGSIVVK